MECPAPPLRVVWLLSCLLAALALGLRAQGLGVDAVAVGPMAVHDHVAFDYHLAVRNDPYPHETRESYAFDGVDLAAAVQWHWGRARFATALRVTPASRLHFAYDQDTDFMPGNASTHGNEGLAHSRTFAVDQTLPLARWPGYGLLTWDIGFLRQWTRYHQVTTYDWNSNPALPSNTYTRLISEQAILYELRPSLDWESDRTFGAWQAGTKLSLTPLSAVFLHNYIPVVLAATSLQAWGGNLALGAGHRLGSWQARLIASAGVYNGYSSRTAGFRREDFSLRLELLPPI